MATQQATEPIGTTATSWQYYPALIDCSRRFIIVSTSAESFQDSRPPPDAVPVTVLLETPTLLLCSVPPMPPEAVHDTSGTPPCETFAEHIATLPQWERELLASATEQDFSDSSLCELLQQKNTTTLAASDGGQKDDHGSFGWVIGQSQNLSEIVRCGAPCHHGTPTNTLPRFHGSTHPELSFY